MDDQEFYYDVSYQRTKEGPVGAMRRSKLEDVAEWLKNDTAGLHFIIIRVCRAARRAAGSGGVENGTMFILQCAGDTQAGIKCRRKCFKKI